MNTEHLKGDRLNSWKEIAQYLGRDVRTAIRWERNKGLPIRRLPGGQRKAVFAYKYEIDQWFDQVQSGSDESPAGSFQSEKTQPTPSQSTNYSQRSVAVGQAEIKLPEITFETPGQTPEVSMSAALSHPVRRRVRVLRALVIGMFAIVILVSGLVAIRSRHTSFVVTSVKKLTNDGTYKIGAVTDGSDIYFSERIDGRLVLSAVPVGGGTIRHIFTALTDAYPIDLSSDGSELLVLVSDGIETEKPLWIVPISGTPRIVGGVRCHDAIWSTDGSRKIAYAAGDSLFVTSDEGKSSRRLGVFGPFPDKLDWHEGSSRLRFLRYETS